MSDDVILPGDPRAARYVTDVKGWVGRDGRFYGDDERAARYAGSTHRACEDCGSPTTPKYFLQCAACRNRRAVERHAARETRPWDGSSIIFSDALDQYFSSWDDIEEYLANEDAVPLEDLRLLHCEPIYASEIEPSSYYHDSLPEDEDDAPKWLEDAFAVLNETIREHRKRGDALSWTPGKIAVDVASLPAPESA